MSDEPSVGDLLADPVILNGAWLRVDSWYSQGELAPQPELSRWRLYPERMLRQLAADLNSDAWHPETWLQVPFPKKGQRLRHYVIPTVRDQVAFMAHMVALGPILDIQTANFAFGNRWYRPIAWNRRVEPARWVPRPYPVSTNNTYLSYPRSHGLFRRVAHWTVSRMTDAPLPDGATHDGGQLPEDFDEGTLPGWTRSEWWSEKSTSDTPRAFWAALDIELAYPSVRIARLADTMTRILREPVTVDCLIDGCPGRVVQALAKSDVRVALGIRLSRALAQVKVDTAGIPKDAWAPPERHPLPRIAADPYEGIPTGLAISGMLLNAALWGVDRAIKRYLQRTTGAERGAIVRFADDMYVLSRSSSGLMKLIEAVHGALAGSDVASLAVPNYESNLCINFSKIRPQAVQDVIGKYLETNHWSPCTCGQPLPPASSQDISPARDSLWASISADESFKADLGALNRSAIKQGDVGPFVTGLVERLSDMGTDTLRQRFGEGARDHLARLHELARFEIDDEQVRPDTRRTFSVNRLVRAWLPHTGFAEQQEQLQHIRQTAGFVLDRTPWKFAMWRAVVRAAARRPLVQSADEETADNDVVSPKPSDPAFSDDQATEWLATQLRRIAFAPGDGDSDAWIVAWPDSDEPDGHSGELPHVCRELYLSFLRTVFWRSLAQVIKELKRHHARVSDSNESGPRAVPDAWATRAVPEPYHGAVAEHLGRIDAWVDVLYTGTTVVTFAGWPWEVAGFVEAVLAAHSTEELANAWRSAVGPANKLLVPSTTRLLNMPHTRALLARLDRLQQTGPRRNRKLAYPTLANILLGHWSNSLGDVLYPTPGQSRVSKARSDAPAALAAGMALSVLTSIRPALAEQANPPIDRNPGLLGRDALLLHDYSRARQILMSASVNEAAAPTVHRLMWGRPESTDLDDWELIPWEIPTLGLPSRIGAALLQGADRAALPNSWRPRNGPLTWQLNGGADVLAAGRRGQFELEDSTIAQGQTLVVRRSTEWEVLPHPAYFIPFTPERMPDAIDPTSYAHYCDVLLLLTVLDGGERILDTLARQGTAGAPFEDRWAWRSRIHLPQAAWTSMERILSWANRPTMSSNDWWEDLVYSLNGWSPDAVSAEDFLPERIDIDLSPRGDLEVARTIRRTGDLLGPKAPDALEISGLGLTKNLSVRVGQTGTSPDRKDILQIFPRVRTSQANAMIEQVVNAFSAPGSGLAGASPDIVVLPELSVPQQEVRELRRLAAKERMAAVAGLYWRKLPTVVPPSKGLVPKRAYFVNEAELVVPVADDRGPPAVRWFRVRKPLPAHMEEGLARALSKKKIGGSTWHLLRGHRWYRFVHPQWGDFTTAICADLIDPAPWRAFRGELLHLLMVAYNRDVDLFDSLTWVRAYEDYVNVVSVNHGQYGGSFVWTPRRTHGRELARLRGSGLVLTADVSLPVKELLDQQKDGVKEAIGQSERNWLGKKRQPTKFKAPPPGYRGRK